MAAKRDCRDLVRQHHQRRLDAGERARTFYVRAQDMHLINQFQVENGLENKHSALQGMMDELRAWRTAACRRPSVQTPTFNEETT